MQVKEPALNIPFRLWADDDKPANKVLQRGLPAMSDSELLSILIGSGNDDFNPLDLAKNLLLKSDNKLRKLGSLSVAEMMKFKGIGQSKATRIVAAMELGRRYVFSEYRYTETIQSSSSVFNIMQPILSHLNHEEFWVVLLKQNNQVIRLVKISSGGTAGTVVDPKIIFKHALDELASCIVLVHNHPSGTLIPSEPDKSLTNKIKSAGQFLDIRVLDHLIVAHDQYYSFADEGLI